MRQLIDHDPFQHLPNNNVWYRRGVWPCSWIASPTPVLSPFVMAYRCRFNIDQAASIRMHVSADERYELFLDGVRIGRGPERGDPRNWRFESYDLELDSGEHMLVARVCSLGDQAPLAQMSVMPGFLLAPEDERLIELIGTGKAPWEVCQLQGYDFVPITWPGEYVFFAIGAQLVVDGSRFVWGFEDGAGQDWQPAQIVAHAYSTARPEYDPIRLLMPAQLPAMIEQQVEHMQVRFVGSASDEPIQSINNQAEQHSSWQDLCIGGKPITISAHASQRIIIDLGIYTCAYPELLVSGGPGSKLHLRWAESLYEAAQGHHKGQRDAIEGRIFRGIGDSWLPDGGPKRRFDTLWWRCGRFLELTIQTQAEPLTIERFTLYETRYPLESEMQLAASDSRLLDVAEIALRALQMCAHETYMDCPYWEQLMYAGDTRLQALVTYTISSDDRLPRAALRHFDASRLPSGLTQSRYPSRVTQMITPFSLWWIGMVYDYALWRDDAALVRELLPGVRTVIDAFTRFFNKDGLLEAPAGWNFMDWAPEWHAGVPPDAELGVSASVNWLYVYTLELVAQLETWHGDAELASRAGRMAAELASRLHAAFWNGERQLFADDLAQQHYSEHTQCLALLSGHLPDAYCPAIERGLLQDSRLTRTTIYFSHYLLEAFTALGRIDALYDRLQLWFDLKGQGFTTTPEMPEPTRSDCHAWGAHPVYHMFASLLGIRPSAPGFRKVRISPQLGSLQWLRGEIPHPAGRLEVDIKLESGQLMGTIMLPPGVTGVLVWDGREQELRAGKQAV